jgi:hypothetical protein
MDEIQNHSEAHSKQSCRIKKYMQPLYILLVLEVPSTEELERWGLC